MGALAAVLSRSGRDPLASVEEMLAAAPHRGGRRRSLVVGSCALGIANRESAVGSFLHAQDGWACAFSGRLDNPDDLRDGAGGTDADPAALVLSAFRRLGGDAATRLRGTFACALSDGERLWCFRDHLGLKPLFYRETPEALLVASEAKQVIAGARLPREADEEVLCDIFYGRTSDETRTALRGATRLPKATLLEASADGSLRRERYWQPERLLETATIDANEVGARFLELFEQAVARCLTDSDAVSLSGGVDSPAVAAFAAPLYRDRTGAPLAALSAVFPDLPRVDERPYIELVAGRLGMQLHTYRPSARALDDVRQWTALLDGPVPTVSVPELNENYALARSLGFGTLLTGELAEFVIEQWRHVWGHLLTHGRLGALARLLRRERGRGISRKFLARQLAVALAPPRLAGWYVSWRGLDRGPRIPDWIDHREANRVPYRRDLLVPGRRRWLEQQLLGFVGPGITIEADEICQAINDVAVRRPFADIDLWEFFLSLPAEHKFPDTASKTLVRRALRGRVPDEILDRRDKTGFNDHTLAQIDYDALRAELVEPPEPLPGIDYARLRAHLDRRDFGFIDLFWARDLAAVHAFQAAL